MIDDDKDLDDALDAAFRDRDPVEDRAKPVTPSPPAADEVDESEMTSVMGPEERKLLQDAAALGSGGAPAQVERQEDRPTARPPSLVEDPVVVAEGPDMPNVGAAELPTEDGGAVVSDSAPSARPSRRPARRDSRGWSLVPFLLLGAAAVYEALR